MNCGRAIRATNFERGTGIAQRTGRLLSRVHLNFPAHSFIARVAIMGVASFGILILLGLLFWIILKGVLVLVVLLFLGSRISLYRFWPPGARMSRSIPRSPDTSVLRAVRIPAVQAIIGGSLLATGYASAGRFGLILAGGICLGLYLRARVVVWP
jgi:hypothetical protein